MEQNVSSKKFPQKCPKCGAQLEIEHGMDYSSLIYCPECGYEAGYIENTPDDIAKMLHDDEDDLKE